jgi:hypothetical protein
MYIRNPRIASYGDSTVASYAPERETRQRPYADAHAGIADVPGFRAIVDVLAG